MLVALPGRGALTPGQFNPNALNPELRSTPYIAKLHAPDASDHSVNEIDSAAKEALAELREKIEARKKRISRT